MTTHGLSETREYRIWGRMKARCSNPNLTDYALYGGRGISVCERWRSSFDAFIADMGDSPSGTHSIDRIDGNGNYEPSNCRWATPKEQARHTSRTRYVTLGGVRMSLIEAVEMAGANYSAVQWRLDNTNQTIEEALRL